MYAEARSSHCLPASFVLASRDSVPFASPFGVAVVTAGNAVPADGSDSSTLGTSDAADPELVSESPPILVPQVSIGAGMWLPSA